MRQTTLPFRTSWNTLPPLSSDTITTQRAVFVWTGRIGGQARLRGRSPVLKHLRTLVCEQVAGASDLATFNWLALSMQMTQPSWTLAEKKTHVHLRRTPASLPPLYIGWDTIEFISSFTHWAPSPTTAISNQRSSVDVALQPQTGVAFHKPKLRIYLHFTYSGLRLVATWRMRQTWPKTTFDDDTWWS